MSSPEEEHFQEQFSKTSPNLLFDLIAQLNEKIEKMGDKLSDLTESKADPLIIGQQQFIQTLMLREERKAAMWRTVAEKTLAGVVWMILVGVALSVWSYLRDHLK